MKKEIESRLKGYLSQETLIELDYLVKSSDWEIKLNDNENVEIHCRLLDNERLLYLVKLVRDRVKINIKASTDGHVIISLI